MSSLAFNPLKEYKRKSKLEQCKRCKRMYIQSRIGQETCLFCIKREDIHKYPICHFSKNARLKLAD